jgi:lipopolysaccharide export system permease protein
MRFSTIISGYLIKYFLIAFAAVQTLIMGLILLFDVIELLRKTASKNIGFGTVLQMGILKLPQMVHVILPFAIMIGAMVVFWKLTKSRELVVIRAAGFSVWEFLAPVIMSAFIIGVLNVTLFNPVSAAMYKKYEHIQDKLMIRHASPLALTQHGLWLREGKGDIQSVVKAKHVRQEGLGGLFMREITVLELTKEDKFYRSIEADRAKLEKGFFYLENVWVMTPGKPSVFQDDMKLKTSLTLGKIQENFATPDTLSFWELPSFIKFFESAGFSAQKHKMHWHGLLASPLLLCAMVLVAAVFSINPNIRQGKILFRVTGSICAGFILYFFSKITYALGLSSTLPTFLAAWSPAIISGLISVTILLHLEDG